MSTHNIDFYEEISKIISELSSNMHLICSSAFILKDCHYQLLSTDCRSSGSEAMIVFICF